jgi:hypothetical protein
MFLLLSNSLAETVGPRRFKERLSDFGLKLDSRAVELFYRRYCGEAGFSLESAQQFLTPVDDSFQKIVLRRELKTPS